MLQCFLVLSKIWGLANGVFNLGASIKCREFALVSEQLSDSKN
jgi:hypothetical protein